MKRFQQASWARRGLTLLESMLLLTVLSIVGIGVGVGLQSSVDIAEADDQTLAISLELVSEMESWRAVVFGNAPWPATLPYNVTDTVTITVGGQSHTYSRTTSIKLYDPNNIATNANPQPDFAQVKITINSQSLTGYMCGLL
jgi:type II secretory pathway pseudopilin PulG